MIVNCIEKKHLESNTRLHFKVHQILFHNKFIITYSIWSGWLASFWGPLYLFKWFKGKLLSVRKDPNFNHGNFRVFVLIFKISLHTKRDTFAGAIIFYSLLCFFCFNFVVFGFFLVVCLVFFWYFFWGGGVMTLYWCTKTDSVITTQWPTLGGIHLHNDNIGNTRPSGSQSDYMCMTMMNDVIA